MSYHIKSNYICIADTFSSSNVSARKSTRDAFKDLRARTFEVRDLEQFLMIAETTRKTLTGIHTYIVRSTLNFAVIMTERAIQVY